MNAAQTTVGKFLIFFPICFPHFFRYCPSAWSLQSIGRRRGRRHGRKAVEKTAFLLFLIFQFVLPSWSVQSIGRGRGRRHGRMAIEKTAFLFVSIF